MSKCNKNNKLSATKEEYDEFLENAMQYSSDMSEDPNYRVHFYCTECRMIWNYEVYQISHAVVKAVREGCPLCNQSNKIALTHHESLNKKDDIDIRDFMVIGVFSDSSENKYPY